MPWIIPDKARCAEEGPIGDQLNQVDVLRANNWHQPAGLMLPWTNLQPLGWRKLKQRAQRWSPLSVPWQLASACVSFCCAAAGEIGAPSASAVPVSTSRRERRRSVLMLFMIGYLLSGVRTR